MTSSLTSQTRSRDTATMSETYSTYEAKAKLSEILRKVESGRTITISRRGRPIAEIRPLPGGPAVLADRVRDLTEQGILTAPSGDRAKLHPLAERPGALGRFLADRDG